MLCLIVPKKHNDRLEENMYNIKHQSSRNGISPTTHNGKTTLATMKKFLQVKPQRKGIWTIIEFSVLYHSTSLRAINSST
jgi:hypothetical protein